MELNKHLKPEQLGRAVCQAVQDLYSHKSKKALADNFVGFSIEELKFALRKRGIKIKGKILNDILLEMAGIGFIEVITSKIFINRILLVK